MSLRQIVMELIARGHQVNYYVRKDGGLVIHTIDGEHYSGKTGNVVARKMLGVALSERRRIQLERINKQMNWKKSATPIPEDLEKYRLKVNRLLRKNIKTGTISKRNMRAMIEQRGIEGAWEVLREQERRAKDHAYYGVIDTFIERINNNIKDATLNDPEDVSTLETIKELVDANRDYLTFDDMWSMFDEVYNYEKERIDVNTLLLRIQKTITLRKK